MCFLLAAKLDLGSEVKFRPLLGYALAEALPAGLVHNLKMRCTQPVKVALGTVMHAGCLQQLHVACGCGQHCRGHVELYLVR